MFICILDNLSPAFPSADVAHVNMIWGNCSGPYIYLEMLSLISTPLAIIYSLKIIVYPWFSSVVLKCLYEWKYSSLSQPIACNDKLEWLILLMFTSQQMSANRKCFWNIIFSYCLEMNGTIFTLHSPKAITAFHSVSMYGWKRIRQFYNYNDNLK